MASKSSTPPVRVRFAPSPTGLTHLGSARTALYNYLLARQTGGQFILRFEDTDLKRYDPEAEDDLINGLHWLGLQWDEGPDIGGPHAPYKQSQRKEIYQQHAERLVKEGKAYYCFCTPQELAQVREQQQKLKQQPHYSGKCRVIPPDEAAQRVAAGESHVVRFKMPKDGSITVHDHLRGDITVENKNLDDYILIKSDGFAVYHLAALVDDNIMDISHVFRGEEWLATFPLHGHIYRAFGWKQPVWVHLSVFLKPSGKGKMSKRDTEAMKLTGQSIFVRDLEKLGYLPEGVVNWIALMGWSYDDRTEFFTLEDLIEKFSIDKLNPSAAAIDFKKFDHFNGLHIRNLPVDDLARRLVPYFERAGYAVTVEQVKAITSIIRERMATLDEGPELAGFFFRDDVEPVIEDLAGTDVPAMSAATALRRALEVLSGLNTIGPETAEEPMRKLAEELGLKAGQLFTLLRLTVTGQRISPPLFESMEIVGKEKVMERIEKARSLLEEHAAQSAS